MYRFPKAGAGRRARLRTRVGLTEVLSLFATLSSKAAELPGIFGGYAYGIDSQTNLAAVDAALDRVGWVGLSCIGSEGQTKHGSVAQLAVPGGVLSAATVANTVFSTKTSTSALARDVSTITGLTALGGLITADAFKAEAIANATPGAIALTGGGSGFTNLKVAGIPIQSNVAPNTKVPLPGFGTLTLRQTKTSGGGSQSFGGIRVEMLVVEVTRANPLGIPAGSKITVGTAASRFERAALPVNMGGEAFAARALGNASKSLRTRIGGRGARFHRLSRNEGRDFEILVRRRRRRLEPYHEHRDQHRSSRPERRRDRCQIRFSGRQHVNARRTDPSRLDRRGGAGHGSQRRSHELGQRDLQFAPH